MEVYPPKCSVRASNCDLSILDVISLLRQAGSPRCFRRACPERNVVRPSDRRGTYQMCVFLVYTGSHGRRPPSWTNWDLMLVDRQQYPLLAVWVGAVRAAVNCGSNRKPCNRGCWPTLAKQRTGKRVGVMPMFIKASRQFGVWHASSQPQVKCSLSDQRSDCHKLIGNQALGCAPADN